MIEKGWRTHEAKRVHRPWRAVRHDHIAASRPELKQKNADSPEVAGGIGLDLLFVTAVLTAFFTLFYCSWPIWEDQAIYHYMAWGLTHGLVPYRDTINMNWPGSLAIHAIARAISGCSGLGLRLLDVGFLVVLSAATSLLLRAYRVGLPMRLLCLTSYLASYFTTDFTQTAQRESFALPLVAVGMACCLIQARWVKAFSWWIPVVCGLTTGLGLAIKPTLVLPLFVAQALPVVVRPLRAEAYRFSFWFVLGEVAAGVCMVLALVGLGSPGGFWEWGVRYTFGAYATVKWPVTQRIEHTVNWSLWAPSMLVACTGGVAFLAGLFDRRERPSWKEPALFAALAALTLGTVLLQGKTHCRYQYHPFFWMLSLAGASALQATFRRKESVAPGRLIVAFCLSTLAMLAFDATYRRQPYLPRGTELGTFFNHRLAPSDEFVLFGFMPTFHSRVCRRTPFPFVDSWVMLSCCGDAAQDRIEHKIGTSLAESVRNPRVQCVLLQRNLVYGARNKLITSEEIASKYVPARDLEALGYTHSVLAMDQHTVFDVWLKDSVGRVPWVPVSLKPTPEGGFNGRTLSDDRRRQ